jgi:RNA polymerase sigma-70 factor (ECF subfamily)
MLLVKNDEKKILQNLIHGDRLAFEKIFQLYFERIYYFTIKYLNNREDAEEITQEVFVKLWNRRQAIKTELSFSSYLFMIAKNAVIDVLRKKQKEAALSEELKQKRSGNYSPADSTLEYKELNNIVVSAINDLPEKRKQIFLMIREEELSYKEIAEKLSISVKTVETHMRLALQQLRKAIGENYDLTPILLFFAAFLY